MNNKGNENRINNQYSIFGSHEICTGCGACVKTCPTQCLAMEEDIFGFSYPKINNPEKCIKCYSCEKICPVLASPKIPNEEPLVYAAYTRNEEIRHCSSSGGIFTEIANCIVNENGCVCGAIFDEKYRVRHVVVTTVEDLSKMRGAKYSESCLGDVFLEIRQQLQNNRTVLFTGTPCQVAGLKAYLKVDYSNLICIDFVCHGVPAPKIWEKYVDFRSQTDADGIKPVTVNMRSKRSGWSHYRYSVQFEYNNTSYTELSFNDIFLKLFLNNTIIRDSCTNCIYKNKHYFSDITLGDFWGIWDIDPSMDDDKGTSVVIIRSKKGKQLFDKIKNNICYLEENFTDASMYNPSMILPSVRQNNNNRELYHLNMNGFRKYLFKKRVKTSIKKVKRKFISFLHNS